jgi:fatty-acyl-CoA synthase
VKKSESYRRVRLTESYWPADESRPLTEITLGDALRAAAVESPNRCALVEGVADPARRRRWTYAELLQSAEQVAASLLQSFSPGERIAVWSANVPEWVLLLYGSALAGVVLVTVNPAYKSRELEYVLGNSGASGLFTMDEYRGENSLAMVEGIRARLPALREVIRIREFEGFLARATDGQPLPQSSPADRCIIMFTSGTTGAQKGVEFHHRGIVNVTNFTQERGGLAVGGVFVNPMPMFHIGALGHAGVGAVMRRATHVLASEWNRELFMDLVQSERGTYSLLVPTMIEAILASDRRADYDLSSLTNIVSGAAIVEAALIERTRTELGSTICNIYGQTEMQGVISAVHCDDSREDQAQTIGQPMPRVEVKIGDPQSGQVLPLGVQGEIYVRGYQTMIGYFNMPAETAKALEPDGWLHSGDLGTMDERGFLKITGRIKDLIKRGGEAIYPREIENLLLEHPKVANAAVLGIPDRYWGEQVAAVIISRSPDEPPRAAELHDFCRANLASYKTPRIWCFTDAFAATETGKLQKFKLVESIIKGELAAETVEPSTPAASTTEPAGSHASTAEPVSPRDASPARRIV